MKKFPFQYLYCHQILVNNKGGPGLWLGLRLGLGLGLGLRVRARFVDVANFGTIYTKGQPYLLSSHGLQYAKISNTMERLPKRHKNWDIRSTLLKFGQLTNE